MSYSRPHLCQFQTMSLALLLTVAVLAPRLAAASPAELANLLVSISSARGDAVGRATRVQGCHSLLREKAVTDLILRYDDARTAHNALLDGWVRSLSSSQLLPSDIPAQVRHLNTAQAKVKDFSDAARAALVRSGCLTTKANWFGMLALAVAPVALDKLWDLFRDSASDETKRRELIRDLEGYRLPPWDSVGPVAAFDWATERYLTAETATPDVLKKGATSVYVNKFALHKEPNKYFTSNKESPPGLKGSYLLYTGPLEELPEFMVFKGKGTLFEQLPPK